MTDNNNAGPDGTGDVEVNGTASSTISGEEAALEAVRQVFDANPQLFLTTNGAFTEENAADLFVATFGHEVRWVEGERKEWYLCSRTSKPGYWSPQNRGGTLLRMQAVWKVGGGGGSMRSAKVKSALALAGPRLAVKVDDFNADPYKIGAANGVIDLRTGNLEPVAPEMLMTKSTGVQYAPDEECAAWNNHLRVLLRTDQDIESEADPDEMMYLQELAGLSMIGLQLEHMFIYLYGGGGNGKGVFADTLHHVLGDYASVIDTQLLSRRGNEHTTGFTDLMSARFVKMDEIPADKIDTSTLKRITGGGKIKGRRIAQDNVEWDATHTLWMLSNDPPNFGTDKSEGIWRRVIYVSTGPTIPASQRQPDDEIRGKLREEAPGILAWAVEGAVRYLQRGKLPDMPKRFRTAADDLRAASDLLAQFISERFTSDVEAKILLKDFRRAYEFWLKGEGEIGPHENGPSSRKLKPDLIEMGYTVASGTHNQRTVSGMRSNQKSDF